MIALFLLASLRWYIVGACWSGDRTNPPVSASRSGLWGGFANVLGGSARAFALSIPICLLVTIGLSAFGVYRAPLELGLLAAIAVAGAVRTRPSWRRLLPGLVALNLLVLLVLVMPPRMQWIAGGWDPGTYVNEGASLVHEGGWERPPERFLQFLDEDTRELFTRDRYGFLELMPVVPLERDGPNRLSSKPFFFPLYPAMLASAHSTASGHPSGGLALSAHINLPLAVITVFLFGMALARFDWRLGAFGAVLLAIQPLLLYHANFPTSEILHLFLMVCILYWLIGRLRVSADATTAKNDPHAIAPRWTSHLPLALLFFLGPLNRLDFLLFGSVLLVALTLADSIDRKASRHGLLELVMLAVAMALGTALSVFVAEAAVQRLGKDVPMLIIGGILLSAGAFVLRLVAAPVREKVLPRAWHLLSAHLHWIIATVVLLGIAAVWIIQAPKTDQPLIWQCKGMWWYLTWPSVLLAALGFLALEWRRLPRAFGAWVLAVAAMALLVLVFGKIHQTWPWAARRYVPTILPLLAALGAWGVFRTKWLGLVLLAVACVLNAPRLMMAWQVMNDDTRLGAQLTAVADQLQPNDLVVADHFVWAAPLRFLNNVHVVNGERFDDTRKFPAQREALASWPGRVLWLTSTGQGMSAFPGPIEGAKKIWAGEPFDYRKVKRANYVGGFTEDQRKHYEKVIAFFVRGFEQGRANPKQFALWETAEKPFPKPGPGDIYINVGDESAKPYLGSGWSRGEGARDANQVWHDGQWIKRLEADVRFELTPDTAASDCDIIVRTKTIYDKRLRQNFAVLANDAYVAQWLCPISNHFETVTAQIPAEHLRPGMNTLTFRVGHLVKPPGKDTRRLALHVDKILIRPRPK